MPPVVPPCSPAFARWPVQDPFQSHTAHTQLQPAAAANNVRVPGSPSGSMKICCQCHQHAGTRTCRAQVGEINACCTAENDTSQFPHLLSQSIESSLIFRPKMCDRRQGAVIALLLLHTGLCGKMPPATILDHYRAGCCRMQTKESYHPCAADRQCVFVGLGCHWKCWQTSLLSAAQISSGVAGGYERKLAQTCRGVACRFVKSACSELI